jgi:hypothetical protein
VAVDGTGKGEPAGNGGGEGARSLVRVDVLTFYFDVEAHSGRGRLGRMRPADQP